MIIIKDVPGLTPRETLEALTDIAGPDGQKIVTGYGGFVVTEDLAERFLRVYLIASGQRPVPARPPAMVEPIGDPTKDSEPIESEPIEQVSRPVVRRTGRRREA